ncbi:hypothetical protein JCM16418_3122 [Paenibacillus pini JCM 16418]|uniref:Uncharacterized protein n=1 Tax=Paenibacillus pini JCM 16418 TaxID=1236976 RepID=W7YN04_9BACL|nr:hypothetical protein JCM16418_3122 [Paenibacillus pini JCM 16418]
MILVKLAIRSSSSPWLEYNKRPDVTSISADACAWVDKYGLACVAIAVVCIAIDDHTSVTTVNVAIQESILLFNMNMSGSLRNLEILYKYMRLAALVFSSKTSMYRHRKIPSVCLGRDKVQIKNMTG